MGVVTPVDRVFVLAAATSAHFEAGHGRIRPVVRQTVDEGVARAALGAIDEWVAVAPFAGIVHLGKTIVTDEVVRWNMSVRIISRFAVLNGKAGESARDH